MTGPSKRNGSNYWHLRKVTPSDLKNNKNRLFELGIGYKGEIWKSLKTTDKGEAEARYKKVSLEVEAMWETWRSILRIDSLTANPSNKPISLNHKARVALAGKDAARYLAKYEDTPDEIPSYKKFFESFADNIRSQAKDLTLCERNEVFELGQELQELNLLQLMDRLEKLLETETQGGRLMLVNCIVRLMQDINGPGHGWIRAKKLAADHGVILTKEGREKLATQIGDFKAKAIGTLKRRLEGDYGKPAWVENLPAFDHQIKPSQGPLVTFASIIERRQQDLSAGIVKHNASATFKKYRRICKEFCEWRNSDDAGSTNKKEMRDWMKSLHTGDNAAKTIRDKVNAIRAVLKWGRAASDDRFLPNGEPLEGLEFPSLPPSDSAARTYTTEQAQMVLRAARKETRTDRRWIPWLLAYTGMRIGELAQLEKDDLEEYHGNWFLLIRVSEERTTKTHKGRVVPIHPSLFQEGFVEFVHGSPKGQIFPGKRLQQKIGKWIKDKVLVDETSKPKPLHGFRHLFQDRSMGRISEGAVDYILGHASRTSAGQYGKSQEMWPGLAMEMEKLESIL